MLETSPKALQKLGFKPEKNWDGLTCMVCVINEYNGVKEFIAVYYHYAGQELIPTSISQISIVRHIDYPVISESFMLPRQHYTLTDIKRLIKTFQKTL